MYQESFKVLCNYSPRSDELHCYGWSWSWLLCSWQVYQGGSGLGTIEATTFSFCLNKIDEYLDTIMAALIIIDIEKRSPNSYWIVMKLCKRLSITSVQSCLIQPKTPIVPFSQFINFRAPNILDEDHYLAYY